MSYISQTIVFVLAIMGVVFKSVKTDENGKTIQTARGIPTLTRPGKTIIALLVLSFAVSMCTTHQKSKSDNEQIAAAQAAHATVVQQLNEVRQQNEVLKSDNEVLKSDLAEVRKTGQQLLEEKVQEISATITYIFDASIIKQKGSDPPYILSKGAKLEILGIHANESLKLPKGWVERFLLEKEFYLTFSQKDSDIKTYNSTAGRSIKQIRTFSNVYNELKGFERLAQWQGAILDARIIVDPMDDWLDSLVTMNGAGRAKFDSYYNITSETRLDWANNHKSIYPIPVSAQLELIINKRKIQTTGEWKGWLAKVVEGENDKRNLCIIKFPVVRVTL